MAEKNEDTTPTNNTHPTNDSDGGKWFKDDFYRALDECFTSDLACCESCYADFVATWPLAATADDARLERESIPADLFYKSTFLASFYTKNEYDEYIKDITCPRCGAEQGPNLWPYSFPFDIDPAFEGGICEIAAIAHRTPFLLLAHPLAQNTLATLKLIADATPIAPPPSPLYRARGRGSSEDIPHMLTAFDAPPRHIVKEGRYNHAGDPVLYLASDEDTCHLEMRQGACIIAEITYSRALKVLDLVDPVASHAHHADKLGTLVYSSLMSAKQEESGLHRPAYVFSRFVADCARHCGIQAIKYPSTRNTGRNFNLVILDSECALQGNATISRFIERGVAG